VRTPVRAAPQRGATPLAALLALDSASVSGAAHGKIASRAQRF